MAGDVFCLRTSGRIFEIREFDNALITVHDSRSRKLRGQYVKFENTRFEVGSPRQRPSLFPAPPRHICGSDVAVVSGLKDYFETTLSYDNVLQLNMGLTYVRIFAALVNVVLESLTTPEQRTRAEPFPHRMPKKEESVLVTRVLIETRAQTE